MTHKGYLLVTHTAFKGFSGRGWSESSTSYRCLAAHSTTVKPIKLSRTKVEYIFGASLETHLSDWKDDPKIHRGLPCSLREIPPPVIRAGSDGEDFAEIIVPDSFEPGSIMVFATDMAVHLFCLDC